MATTQGQGSKAPPPPPADPGPTAPIAPAPTAGDARPATGARARTVSPALPSAAERAQRAQELLEKLKARFPAEILEVTPRDGVIARVRFPPEAVVRLCTWLRDEGSFAHCAMVAGIDWREHREVVYTLWSDPLRAYLELSATIPGDDAHIASISHVWFGANWHEREAWDLVGIRFDRHPDLRRIFLPEGYLFHPLLKTFELHEPEELEVKARNDR